MKKHLRYVAIAFVVFYLLSSPQDAAATVNTVFAQLQVAGDQLTTFVDHL
jgi:hypothetical protein